MTQISLNLSKLSIADLLQTANNIKTAMTDNANFATPSPSLANIGTLITGLVDANNTYETGQLTQKTNLTNRDDAAQALMDGLMALAGYVQSQSVGDAVKIQSAGMSVKLPRASIGALEQVQNLSIAADGEMGRLDLQWDPTHGNKGYEIQLTTDPNVAASWQLVASCSGSRWSLESLTSGQKLWVRVRAKAPKKANFGA